MFAVTVDIEPDIPGYVKEGYFGINQGLPSLLETLDKAHVRADFYVTASILPRLLDRLSGVLEGGHAIGLHGLTHNVLAGRPYEVQRNEIETGFRLLQEHLGIRSETFRAPNFGADEKTFRAVRSVGIGIDSSVLPGRIVRSGLRTVADHRGAGDSLYEIRPLPEDRGSYLLEVPMSENPFARGRPIGIGYLNTFGAAKTLEAVRQSPSRLTTFLVHPWECIDLTSLYPSVPKVWESGCRSDLSELREFLTLASREFSTTTVAAYGAAYRQTHPETTAPMSAPRSRTVVYASEFVDDIGASTAFSRRSKSLAKGLAALGLDVALATNDPGSKTPSLEGVRIVRVRSPRETHAYRTNIGVRVATSLVSSLAFARLLRRSRPGVVIVSFHEPLHAFFMTFSSKLQGLPRVLDAQDSWLVLGQTHRGPLRNRIRTILERSAMHAADAVTTVTPTLKELICTAYHLPPAKVEVVYNGADSPGEASTRKKDIEVIHLGSPREYYDTLPMVEALGRYRASGNVPRVVFLGCAEDTYVAAIRRRVEELGMSDRFTFLPPVPPETVGEWLDRSEIALHTFAPNPIYGCAIGVKVFEYMAHGVPVVHCGPAGGETARLLTEGNCGVVVDSLDGLGAAMEALLRDHARRSTLAACARLVAAEHTWAKSAEALNAAVQRLTVR